MKKNVACIICPHGCAISVTGEPKANRIDQIEGYRCPRGQEYARQEFLSPTRILTASVRMAEPGRRMLPVRSSAPVPLELLFSCMAEIRKQTVHAPVSHHQVIVRNILNTGADIVASMPLE